MKLRIRHTKLGKVRFTSHRDTARHWERGVRKAGLRLAYSSGFTPRPRLSFGLALPTGAESLAEFLDLELAADSGVGESDLDGLRSVLTDALPMGYEVTCIAPREPGSPSLQEDVVQCEWVIALAGVSAPHLDDAVAHLLAAPEVLLERERKGQRSTDDVRPAVIDLSVAPAVDDPRPHLCAMLATNGRGLRPTELVAAMFPALDPVDTAARVLRTRQLIERDGLCQDILPADPVATRAPLGCA